MPAVKLTWYQGVEQARALDSRQKFRNGASGVLFIGDKGMLLSDYFKHTLLPEQRVRRLQAPGADNPQVDAATMQSGSTPARPATPRPATSSTPVG